MTAIALSLAYLGTLAFVGALVWMRRMGPPSMVSRVEAAEDAGLRASVDARRALDEATNTLKEVAQMRVDVSAIAFKLGMGNRAEPRQ